MEQRCYGTQGDLKAEVWRCYKSIDGRGGDLNPRCQMILQTGSKLLKRVEALIGLAQC